MMTFAYIVPLAWKLYHPILSMSIKILLIFENQLSLTYRQSYMDIILYVLFLFSAYVFLIFSC